jgi:hypothetical protein
VTFLRGLSEREKLVVRRFPPRQTVPVAMGTPWVPRNPRKIDNPAQILEILKLAA